MSVWSAPATKGAAITPSDTKDSTTRLDCRAIYVGTTGNISLVFKDDASDTAVTLTAVPVGTLEVSAKYVLSTSTTATNLVALY